MWRGPPVRGHRSRRARAGDRAMPGQLAPRRKGSSRLRDPRDEHVGGQHRRRRRLIGRAAVVGISDAVAAATRVPDRMVVSRRSGKVGAPGSGAARQIVGWHADRIPPHHSVRRKPGHRLMDASFGLARLVSCRPWHPPPGSGPRSGAIGPQSWRHAGRYHGNGGLVHQRRPAVRVRGHIAARRPDRGRKSARVRVLGPLTPRPASGRLATARLDARRVGGLLRGGSHAHMPTLRR